MLTISQIRTFPTEVKREGTGIADFSGTNYFKAIHESCLRSFQILQAVKTMLSRGDSRETISEFVAQCEARDADAA